MISTERRSSSHHPLRVHRQAPGAIMPRPDRGRRDSQSVGALTMGRTCALLAAGEGRWLSMLQGVRGKRQSSPHSEEEVAYISRDIFFVSLSRARSLSLSSLSLRHTEPQLPTAVVGVCAPAQHCGFGVEAESASILHAWHSCLLDPRTVTFSKTTPEITLSGIPSHCRERALAPATHTHTHTHTHTYTQTRS